MALEIFVRNRDLDGALRLLRRKISREAVFRTLQDHNYALKPGEKLRRKRARSDSRKRKARARAMKKLGDAR